MGVLLVGREWGLNWELEGGRSVCTECRVGLSQWARGRGFIVKVCFPCTRVCCPG